MINAIYGKKIGMTQIFDEDDRIVPVTVIQAEPNTVCQVKTVDTDGYEAVQMVLAAGDSALHEDQVLLLVDAHDLEVLHGHGIAAHVARQARRGVRRAPVVPARVPSALPSGPAAVPCSARTPAPTTRRSTRRY